MITLLFRVKVMVRETCVSQPFARDGRKAVEVFKGHKHNQKKRVRAWPRFIRVPVRFRVAIVSDDSRTFEVDVCILSKR